MHATEFNAEELTIGVFAPLNVETALQVENMAIHIFVSDILSFTLID